MLFITRNILNRVSFYNIVFAGFFLEGWDVAIRLDTSCLSKKCKQICKCIEFFGLLCKISPSD